MLTRRSVVLGLGAVSVTPNFGARFAFGQAARPRLHAMIVGINTYKGRIARRNGDQSTINVPIPQLQGCINDAKAIEAAVRPLAATTRLLLEGDVTRAAFLKTWQEMVADSTPGDTLLVTYSGHGSQERQANPGAAADALHDSFILANFDSSKAGLSQERILDEEMQGLWKSVQDRNKVIFVADACHSGGMTRKVDARISGDLRYRTAGLYDVGNDLTTEVKMSRAPNVLELPHVVFLSGAQSSELVPEFTIDGRPQGALSWSFANAIAGRADTNGDGVVTGAELSSYILRTIRILSDSGQHPNVRWPQADVRSGIEVRPDSPLFFLGSMLAGPNRAPRTDQIRLEVRGTSDDQRSAIAKMLKDATLVDPGQPADLTWDASTREIFDKFGNTQALRLSVEDLQAVVDSARAIESIRQMTLTSGLDMRLVLPEESILASPSVASDSTHVRGTHLMLVATGLRYPYLILFNITGDGTLQFLYPLLERKDPTAIDPEAPYKLPLDVSAPFGADHLVAVASAREQSDLLATLRKLDGKKEAALAAQALKRSASNSQTRYGIQGIFTRER
jgi:Caspase domain